MKIKTPRHVFYSTGPLADKMMEEESYFPMFGIGFSVRVKELLQTSRFLQMILSGQVLKKQDVATGQNTIPTALLPRRIMVYEYSYSL